MTETDAKTNAGPEAAAASPAPPGAEAGEHQNDGRYIPYSGGSLGWYENSGVPAAEKRNNYLFHTAMDAGVVRAKQYLRSGLLAEKRRSARRKLSEKLMVFVKSASEEKVLRILDISTHGARLLHVGDTIALKNSDRVICRFQDAPQGPVLLELKSTVVWSEKTGKARPVWNYGIDFPMMTPEQLEKLKEIGKLGASGEAEE
jgi:hypothetical protein